MSDRLTPTQRHKNMAAIHSSSTKPEVILRHSLWRLGFRYLINDKLLPGKPDIVLPKYNTIVFIHGCFWHRHDGCKGASIPKSRQDYWLPKFDRNVENDKKHYQSLKEMGWRPIVIWECEVNKHFEATMDSLVREIRNL